MENTKHITPPTVDLARQSQWAPFGKYLGIQSAGHALAKKAANVRKKIKTLAVNTVPRKPILTALTPLLSNDAKTRDASVRETDISANDAAETLEERARFGSIMKKSIEIGMPSVGLALARKGEASDLALKILGNVAACKAMDSINNMGRSGR